MSFKQVEATATIDSPPCLELTLETDWGWFVEDLGYEKRTSMGGRTTTGKAPPAVDGGSGCAKGGDATLSESILLSCNKNMIGLPQFQDGADFRCGQDDQTTYPPPRPPCSEKIKTSDKTSTTATIGSEFGTDVLTGNSSSEDLSLLLVEPLPPALGSSVSGDEPLYSVTKNGDNRSSHKEDSSADDGDAVVMVVKKRKRGKDLSCLLHRRAQELEAKAAKFPSREAAIENKAQALLDEIKRQDDMIRHREWSLLNRERESLEYQVNVQAMRERLWLDRQKLVQQQQDDDCFICFERPIDCILVPCGHLVACMDCVDKMKGVCCICNQRSRPQKIFRTLA